MRTGISKGRKFIACAAAFAMLGITAVPVSAASQLTKEETVYVVTEADGSQSEITVSDHLKNASSSDKLTDKSNLKNIENVKGDETFEQGKNNSIIWDAQGNDIFYEGTTQKETPVTMGISYFLNGEEVEGKDMKGASGDIEIVIDYRNNAVDDNGTTVPFIAMTGFIAEDDAVTDLDIDHGKIIDDGDKKIVVGIAAPGLADALDIDLSKADIDLEDSVTIKGTAKDFNVQDMMTIVTNSVFQDIDTDDFIELDYDDEISQLNKGAKQLESGTDALYQGIDKLYRNVPKLTKGIDQLKTGADKIQKGTNKALAGSKKLSDGMVKLSGSLKTKMKEIAGAASQMQGGTENILGGLKKIKKGLDQGDNTEENPGAINVLDEVASGLKDGSEKTKNGAKDLEVLSEKIGDGADSLEGAAEEMKAGAKTIIDNKENFDNAAKNLSDENIQGVIDALKDSGTSDELAGKVEAMLKAGQKSANGGSELAQKSADGFNTAADKISAGADSYKTAAKALSKASDNMEKSAVDLGTARFAVAAVSEGLQTISTNLGAYDKSKGADQKTLIGGLTVINNGLDSLDAQATQAISKNGQLTKGLNRLINGTKDLENGEEALAGGSSQLAKGMEKMQESSVTLSDGVSKLDDGALKLRKGMSKMYKEGIKKIVDMYNNDLKGSLDNMQDLMDAGKSYKTFTKLSAGMDGSVKFIYKTTIYE